ncbi:MAG: hypothetical protein B7Y99_09290 [Caulobacterales bacterium 32-69-10]|nr:MAG: hypothetical protein B7Y99_09290 [Caulobacterales bacterium 32-69-10]
MFTRTDIAPLSIAVVSAMCAGLGLGAWASPPAHLAEPALGGELQPIYGDDPNLARYKQVIAEQGGPGPLYIVTGYTGSMPPPEEIPDEGWLEAQVARDAAAFDAQTQAWEAKRSAWLETLDAPQTAQPPLPVAYAGPDETALQEPPETLPAPG